MHVLVGLIARVCHVTVGFVLFFYSEQDISTVSLELFISL